MKNIVAVAAIGIAVLALQGRSTAAVPANETAAEKQVVKKKPIKKTSVPARAKPVPKVSAAKTAKPLTADILTLKLLRRAMVATM
jgi:hypothetical protein